MKRTCDSSKLLKFYAILAVSVFISLPSAAWSRETTLDECLHMAYTKNRSLTVDRYAAEKNENLALSTFSRLFVRFRTDARVTAWDSPLDARLNAASSVAPLDPVLDSIATELGNPDSVTSALDTYENDGNFKHSVHLRNQFTLDMNVSAVQPITDIYGTFFQYKAYSRLRDANKLEASRKRDELAEKVIVAYFGLIRAKELKSYSQQALEELDGFLSEKASETPENTKKLPGSLHPMERFELENLRDRYRKLAIQAEMDARIATEWLHTLMNDERSDTIEPVSPELPDENLLGQPFEKLVERSVAQRPDFAGMRKRISAQRALRSVALGEFFPKFSLFGSYDYRVGQGQLLRENTYYGGLALNWSIWEWGATYYQLTAANTDLERQKAELDAMHDEARVEVVRAQTYALRAKDTLAIVEEGYTRAVANYFFHKNAFLTENAPVDRWVRAGIARLESQRNLAEYRSLRFITLYRLKLAVGDLILIDPEKLYRLEP